MKTINKSAFTISKLNTDSIDEERFNNALSEVIAMQKGMKGIGTLSEKSVHAVLKHYYASNHQYHEVKIGNFVADACVDGEIYEIQSKSFYLMKNKLNSFLKNYDVTIIHPISLKKYIRYIDQETGEIKERRLSNKTMILYDALLELYSIKDYLNNKHLHFIFCFMETEEYKLLDGYGKDKKIKATKTDKVPTKLVGEFYINKKRDFLDFLPGYKNGRRQKDCPLPKEFTSNDIATYAGCNADYARYLLNILSYLGLIKNIGNKGRNKLYTI